jgi:uncharacterized glyoxalase superfamily protein PhnB
VVAVPKGYHTVTPYLTVRGAAAAIDFYKKAFGAKEKFRMPGPDGTKVMHAELQVGDSVVMLSDDFSGAPSAGGAPVGIFLYVPDVDAAFTRAVAAGCTVTMALADMFWGDRFGKVADPFGLTWSMATHKRDVPPKEMAEAAAKAFPPPGPPSS